VPLFLSRLTEACATTGSVRGAQCCSLFCDFVHRGRLAEKVLSCCRCL
jgi:hypothetical protein